MDNATHTDQTNSVLPHADNPAEQSEHLAVMDLVPTSKATHIAIKSGSWFDPTIWQNGEVPNDGADVWIKPEVAVTYDAQSEARIHTIRLDGTLEFAADRSTKLLIDTFVVAPKGTLIIGDSDRPIEGDRTARIIFTSDRAIDTTWDPKQFSRGLISHGNASIYGADKLDFTSLAHDAIAGDRELVLNLPTDTASPLGWKVGDQLVLGGTSYESWGDDAQNTRFHDEVLTITKIDGNRIQFTNNDIHSGDNTQLRFNHTRPAGHEENLSLYVANTTRNISFETENGDAAPLHNRGHVMFMHNPNVAVENAGFYNLGRTDKNQLIDDVGKNVDGSPGYGTNPRGRYPLHFHRTGVESAPVMATGNAIVGSPGWGLVQHDSSAILEDNVVFDVVGAGIVAEAGNETGTWRDNLTIKTTGDDRRYNQDFFGPRSQRFDFGFNGEGYWVQGAGQVSIQDNVAISAGTGIGFLGFEWGTEAARAVQTIPVDSLPSSLQDIAKGTNDPTQVEVSAVPLRQVTGFESYNTGIGINVWSRMFNGDGQLDVDFDAKGKLKPAHDYRSVIDDFKLWNVVEFGVLLPYSGNVDLNNGFILGTPEANHATGIYTTDASLSERYKNIRIEGFINGLSVPYDANRDFVGSQIEQVSFADNTQNFAITRGELLVSAKDADFPAFFQIRAGTTFQPVSGNISPVAQFSAEAVGGYAVEFDAGSSFDADSPLLQKNSHGIVSYGWDFNGDGKVDQFGRKVSHDFGQAGTRNVSLTVWDNQGATQKITQPLTVKPTNYKNPILNGDFSSPGTFLPFYVSDSSAANHGWYALSGAKWDSVLGAAVLSDRQNYVTSVGQIWEDNQIRKGQQTLALDLKNIEGGSSQNNQIQVTLWGVNGQFNNNFYWASGPEQAGALPMQRKQLVSQTFGPGTFDWTHQSWNVDLADGYQFLMAEVRTLGANDANDFIALDNVQLLGDAPQPSIPTSPNRRISPANPDWEIGGTGDFNKDGKSDVLYRNRTTGDDAIAIMDDTNLSQVVFTTPVPDVNWIIGGVGDFNHDGSADAFVRNRVTGQNAIAIMDGTNLNQFIFPEILPDPNWSIGGVGDFNKDGNLDLLYRNRATGENAFALLNGTTLMQTVAAQSVPDLNWEIGGVGDFNRDGNDDVLFRNKATGENAFALMNGTEVAQIVSTAILPDLSWSIGSVGDYNRDGNVDILYRNQRTGENSYALMNGTNPSQIVSTMAVTDTNWQIGAY